MNKTFLIAIAIVALITAGLWFVYIQPLLDDPGPDYGQGLAVAWAAGIILYVPLVLIFILAFVGALWELFISNKDASGKRKSPLVPLVVILVLIAIFSYFFLLDYLGIY